jgi:autotransporter-associated beta strand protein
VGTTVSSIRFNDGTSDRTISVTSGTLVTGGVLVTANVGAHTSTITGSSLQASGAGQDLVLVQNNTAGNLNIGSNITDNGTSNVVTAGAGTIVFTGQNTYAGVTIIGGGTLFTLQQALYNNHTSAPWDASHITVGTGATLGLRVGGAGEFTPSDVATLAALGTATGGFQNGSTLLLDTLNAGSAVNLTAALTNTNGGANSIGLIKNGTPDVVLFGAANSYTGPTTINNGFLRLASGGSLPGNGVLTLGSNSSTGLDLNGGTGVFSGFNGGAVGSTIALGTGGTFTVNDPAVANKTFAGNFTGTGSISFTRPTGTTQTLTGSGAAANLTVGGGTLALNNAAGTTWGSASSNIAIANVDGVPAFLTVGSPTGASTNLTSNLIVVGGDPAQAFFNGNNFNGLPTFGPGGLGTLNVNVQGSGTTTSVKAATLFVGSMAITANATNRVVNIGTNAATGGILDVSPTVELTGTTFTQYGILGAAAPGNAGTLADPALSTTANLALVMATNNNNDATVNIAGANTSVKIENNSSIVMGRYYSRVGLIAQSAGNVTFYSNGGSTVGGTGRLIFDTDNPANTSNFQYQLNGGTLTVPQIYNAGNAAGTIALVLNGGTLAVGGSQYASNFITGSSIAGGAVYTTTPVVRVSTNGGTIDLNGIDTTITAGIFHDPTAGVPAIDGGLTIKSTGTGAVLTLFPQFQLGNSVAAATITANTLTGPISIVSGTLKPAIFGAVSSSGSLRVGTTGTLDFGSISDPGRSTVFNNQTLAGTGHVLGQVYLQSTTSVVTDGDGGGIGIVGDYVGNHHLSFDAGLDLAGGKLRADIGADQTHSDLILAPSQGGYFGASGSPRKSTVEIDITTGSTLPVSTTTIHLVDYGTSNFFGSTVTYHYPGDPVGTDITAPANLFITTGAGVTGINSRSAQLSLNTSDPSHHYLNLIYRPGATAGVLTWDGGTAHTLDVWDTANVPAWHNTASSNLGDVFLPADAVTFDDSAPDGTSSTGNVKIEGLVAPSTMTVNSSAKAYTFLPNSFGSRIGGNVVFTKTGTSTLTMKTANDFGGTVTLGAGTTTILDPGDGLTTGGLGRAAITIAAAATPTVLQIGDGNPADGGTLAATGIATSGTTGSATINVNRTDTFTLTAGPMTTVAGTSMNVTFTGGGTGHVTLYGSITDPFTQAVTASTYTGTATVLNQSTSAFGDGWTLQGLEQITTVVSSSGPATIKAEDLTVVRVTGDQRTPLPDRNDGKKITINFGEKIFLARTNFVIAG